MTPLWIPVWQAVVLAAVQGVAEFLPISSTAHLVLFPWLLGWTDPGLTFDVALHFGTLVAVLGFFFPTWIRILRAGFGAQIDIHTGAPVTGAALKLQQRLLWLLVLATVPGGIIGFLFEKQIESTWRDPRIIAVSLIVVGVLMGWADREPKQKKDFDKVSPMESLWLGIAQAFAVIPGVSRSGSTITAGLWAGLTREAAARFSFLMATPIIAGACLKKGMELHKQGIPAGMHTQYLVGVVVSAIVGIASIGLFIRFLRLRSLSFFVYYRVALGLFVFAAFYYRVFHHLPNAF